MPPEEGKTPTVGTVQKPGQAQKRVLVQRLQPIGGIAIEPRSSRGCIQKDVLRRPSARRRIRWNAIKQ